MAAPTVAPSTASALARLIGIDRDEFARDYWGQQALLTPAVPGHHFADLLGADAVDELVSERGLRTPFLRVARNGATLADSTFTAPGGVGATISDQVSDDKLVGLFAEGATLVLQALHRVWPPVAAFCRQLAADLGHPVQANAYVTPPQNQGFSDHYDVHDVFVLQISGEKRWIIHNPVLPAPLRNQPWTDRRRAVEQRAAEEPLIDAVLRPGDCLYLPRGFLHAATALGGVSTHLTLGVHSWTRHALAEQLLQQALRTAATDPDVRASLALGVEVTDAGDLEADLELVRQRLIEALRTADSRVVAAALAPTARAGQRAAPIGPLRQRAALDDLAPSTRLEVRSALAGTLTDRSDGGVVVTSRAGTVTIAAADRDAFGAWWQRGSGAAGDLGLELARTLLLAGLAVPGVSSPGFRCADAARERDDPLLGTAPTARAFLLIEHPGPWRFDALSGTGWSAAVIDAIAAAVRETRSRVLLIRRPGRRSAATERAWAVVRVGVGSRWHTWRDETDLLVAAEALRQHDDIDPSSWADPLLLVCAHGVHDTCCAVRGRPVAATLADSWPGQTWECSHVGGDRFAANLVVLPDGTYYGGLDPEVTPSVVAAHLAGRVDPGYLRGSVRWPPVAQVAVGEVHRRFGPYAADEVRADRWTAAGESRWLVAVVAPSGRYQVEVNARRRAAAVLTCAAPRATVATSFVAVGVHDDR